MPMQNSLGNSSSRGDMTKLVIVGIILVAMSFVMGEGGLYFLVFVAALFGETILWHRWRNPRVAPGFKPDDADDDE